MTSPAAGQASAEKTLPENVSELVTEIAGLLAWARSLSDAGSNTDPAERAAYQAAKTALLARITGHPSASNSARDAQ